MDGTAAPAVSVVVTLDYDPARAQSHADLRQTVRAVASQAVEVPVEILVVETPALARALAEAVRDIPDVQVLEHAAHSANALANAGARAARGPLVVHLDGDCVPAPGWLAALVDAIRAAPQTGVVSGRTRYREQSFRARALDALTRGGVECARGNAPARVTVNNFIARRAALHEVGLPERGPFSTPGLSVALRRAGWALGFAPDAVVHHRTPTLRDGHEARRATGYWGVQACRDEPGIPWAGLTRLGLAALPLLYVGRTARTMARVVRWGAAHGLRPWELPVVLALAPIVCAFEIPGMAAALRGAPPPRTAFR